MLNLPKPKPTRSTENHPMNHPRTWTAILSIALATACGGRATTNAAPATPAPSPGEDTQDRPGSPDQEESQQTTYEDLIKDGESDEGLFTVHKKDEDYLFEIPDSLLGRDLLLISRIAGKMDGMGGFTPAGSAVNRQMLRFERRGDRIMMRKHYGTAVADDTLAIAASVEANYFAPILESWEIEARGPDSASSVIDVTDFFGGDTPSISGLSSFQRRDYQVRRLDADRSFISRVRSYPLNINVRHTLTYDAGAPPNDAQTNTVSLEMNQSLVLLPAEPMRPRYSDPRVGYFTVSRINYGLNEQKAATETFIRRWRMEPSDPEAYARGEVVDPVNPIIYYVDPATPERYVDAVRRGIENWQAAFETAGFSNAIVAREAPSKEEDPDWDPEDVRYSVARWSASEVRNAVGPSTSDPRTGEIIESDIVWFHNHMRSYRNWMMVQTGAANPDARQLPLTDELMEEAMEQVNHPRGRARDRASAQHGGQFVVPRRFAAFAELCQQDGRRSDDHGLRAPELHRAAGGRARAEGLPAADRGLRPPLCELGVSCDPRRRNARGRDPHAQPVDRGPRARPHVQVPPGRTRRDRPARADRGHGR